jgi:hypothetical protein
MITDLPECDGYDVVVVFVYMLTKRKADYKNNYYSGAISEGYAPRFIPALWFTTEADIRSRSPVYERLLANLIWVCWHQA